MLKDYLKLAITSIRHRQLRSWLTVIGIIIGIAAIISLITVSQGLQNAITAQFEQFGSDRIWVTPKITGATLGSGLTTDDEKTLEKIPELEWIDSAIMMSDEVEFSREKKFIQQIIGAKLEDIEKVYSDVGYKIEQGAYPRSEQSGVAVIGHRIANHLFDKEIKINNQIILKDKKFRVIGIFQEIGNSDDDNTVIIPISELRGLYSKPNEVSAFQIKIKQGIDVNEIAQKIQDKLERARDDDAFTVMTPESLLRQLGSILSIVQVVLGGITAISLLVGGIGIMNSMYTSVLERTNQIGIMKSLGARNSHIFSIFIVEAGMLGLVGGIIGVALGCVISLLVGEIALAYGFAFMKIIIDFKLLLFGLSFSIIIGMFSGYLPANRAAKMQPVEAFRHD